MAVDVCIDTTYLTRDWKPALLTPINRYSQRCKVVLRISVIFRSVDKTRWRWIVLYLLRAII